MTEPGAEIIRLDSRRRPTSAAESELRDRCREPRADGAPCRLYLDEQGLCRVCQPGRATPAEPRPLLPAPPRFDDRTMDDLEQAVRGILSFARRRLTGDFEVDDYGFDRDLTEQVIMPLARPLYQQWWRVRAAGIGNVIMQEACFLVGVDPRTPIERVPVETRQELLETASTLLIANVTTTRRTSVPDARPGTLFVYGRTDRPCRRCGTPTAFGRPLPDARPTWWCPSCQASND